MAICQRRDCRKEKGIRVNNWLNGSRLPINGIVYFIYSWAHELTSVTYCKRELGIGKNAVVDANLQQHGFQHNQVNHKYNFVDPNSGTHTQNVERMWGAAK